MTAFISVTDGTNPGTVLRINVEHIVGYQTNTRGTLMRTTAGQPFVVRESTDQIDAMLRGIVGVVVVEGVES